MHLAAGAYRFALRHCKGPLSLDTLPIVAGKVAAQSVPRNLRECRFILAPLLAGYYFLCRQLSRARRCRGAETKEFALLAWVDGIWVVKLLNFRSSRG